MRSIALRAPLSLAVLALGGATAGACAFIDRFPPVAEDPAGEGGRSASAGFGGGADATGSAGSGGGMAVPCPANSKADCYDGPANTRDKGPCKGGEKVCAADGMGYGACVGEVLPAFQSCKPMAMDTNCDGVGCVGAPDGSKGFGDDAEQGGTAVATRNGLTVITGFANGGIDLGAGPTAELGDPKARDTFLAAFDTSLTPRYSHRFADSEGLGVALSPANGDVVLVGSASGDVDFGTGKLPAQNAAHPDAFVARFTATGKPLSSQRFGDVAADQFANAVAVGGDGNAIVAGAMAGGLDCKNGTQLTSTGGTDVFVAKVDPDSKVLWCKAFGNAADQQATAVAVTTSGNIIVAGWFSGSINLGGMTHNVIGDINVFVAELDPSGACVWSKSFGGSGYSIPTGVALDSAGNAVLAGYFSGQLKVSNQIKLNTSGMDENAFVFMLDTTGKPMWGKSIGDDKNQEAAGVSVDAEGNIVVAGNFGGTIDVGVPEKPSSKGGLDAFALKLDPAGNGLWAKGFGDSSDQSISAVAVDSLGAAWLTGRFAGNIDFGGGAVVSGGGTDAFLAKLTP